MVKSNQVQLLRESHTRALVVPHKLSYRAKMSSNQGQTKVFHGSKRHTWVGKINQKSSGLVIRRLYFFQQKKRTKILVLGNLTHILRCSALVQRHIR